MSALIRFFICGSALTGEPDHGNLNGARMIAEARTAPNYRLHSVRDEHPGIYHVAHGGVSIAGELYELTTEQYEALLAGEPPDMYEDTVLLEDGTLAQAMLYPRDLIDRHGYPDVSAFGGWRSYRKETS